MISSEKFEAGIKATVGIDIAPACRVSFTIVYQLDMESITMSLKAKNPEGKQLAKHSDASMSFSPEQLREVIVGLVRLDTTDLSARQLAIFLITNLEPGPHTVRGIAARLEIAKPAITRSLDRLAEFDLAKRMPDRADRRSVLVGRTRNGSSYLATLKRLVAEAAKAESDADEAGQTRRSA